MSERKKRGKKEAKEKNQIPGLWIICIFSQTCVPLVITRYTQVWATQRVKKRGKKESEFYKPMSKKGYAFQKEKTYSHFVKLMALPYRYCSLDYHAEYYFTSSCFRDIK